MFELLVSKGQENNQDRTAPQPHRDHRLAPSLGSVLTRSLLFMRFCFSRSFWVCAGGAGGGGLVGFRTHAGDWHSYLLPQRLIFHCYGTAHNRPQQYYYSPGTYSGVQSRVIMEQPAIPGERGTAPAMAVWCTLRSTAGLVRVTVLRPPVKLQQTAA